MLSGLIMQYVLGMVLAMFGAEEESKRTLFDHAIFFAHAIIGLLLLIGSVVIYRLSKKIDDARISRIAFYGMVSIIIAVASGLATIALEDNLSELASLAMAIAFLTAFALYGYLFFLLRKE